MAESGSGRNDPFADVISLAAAPIAAVIRSFDQLRKGAEELRRGLENFNSTMSNLNETAERVNRLLNDFEEPVRAMVPQLTRTIKMADDLSLRLAVPIDQVVPGLTRLAETLNSPVLRSLPTSLSEFLTVINDLSRRMSPLTQIAEQATSLFGLRIPGMPSRSPTTPARPTPTAATTPARPTPAPATTPSLAPAPAPVAATTKKTTARKTTARKTTARKRTAKKAAAPKKATAKRATAKKATAKKRAAAKRPAPARSA
jgi:ABC-type transporter Mla subunit MlaD